VQNFEIAKITHCSECGAIGAACSVNSCSAPIKGRYVFANPFCKHFNIRVSTTQKFIDPTIAAAAGRLYLKLRETISVTLGPRPRKKKA